MTRPLVIKSYSPGAAVSWQTEDGETATGTVWSLGPERIPRSRWVIPDGDKPGAVLVQIPARGEGDGSAVTLVDDWRNNAERVAAVMRTIELVRGADHLVQVPVQDPWSHSTTWVWHLPDCPGARKFGKSSWNDGRHQVIGILLDSARPHHVAVCPTCLRHP